MEVCEVLVVFYGPLVCLHFHMQDMNCYHEMNGEYNNGFALMPIDGD
jgi:hypothetical protein